MRLLLLLVLFAVGCGPSYLERLQAAEAERQQAVCAADPQGCLLYQYLAGQAAADMQAPPAYQAAPQRVFIRRWQTPGRSPDPRPLGYFDVY